MKRIVWFSDIHLGLKTSEIDRTQEIVDVSLQAVKRACKHKALGRDVILVVGGDIFNHNDPTDYLISKFIKIINPAVTLGIETYILVGNHDSISDPKKKSCLESLKKMKGAYKCVKVIDDMKVKKWFTADYGNVHLTFFPHITKAHIEGSKYKSTQDYINGKAETIFHKVGPGQNQIVFSHLNVRGLIPGSEENLLKKSEVWLPEIYVGKEEHKAFNGSLPPTIIQGHIHSKQKIENIHVVGSPIYCDFGEKENKKFFCEIRVPERFDEKLKVKYIRTKCRPFIELELEAKDGKLIEKGEKKKITKDSVVKINVTLHEMENVNWNWEKIRKKYAKKCHYVKPIVPKYLKDRVTRNEKQTLKLPPSDASRVWLKNHKPKNWKRKLRIAKDYIEKAL